MGFSVQQRVGGLQVKYRWRCLRPPNREYCCFTHVIDEQERIVGYLDHEILGGSPSMITWRKDDLAIERGDSGENEIPASTEFVSPTLGRPVAGAPVCR